MKILKLLLSFVAAASVYTPTLGHARSGCDLVDRINSSQSSEAIEPPDRQLIVSLTDWIAQHTPYDVSLTAATPPLIRFCRMGEAIRYEGKVVVVEPYLQAAYDLKSRIIYLVAPWHASRIEDQAILLHELIHDVQFSARKWDCLQQPEYEAYSLHAKWLEEHGLAAPFDLSQVFIRSRCVRSHH